MTLQDIMLYFFPPTQEQNTPLPPTPAEVIESAYDEDEDMCFDAIDDEDEWF